MKQNNGVHRGECYQIYLNSILAQILGIHSSVKKCQFLLFSQDKKIIASQLPSLHLLTPKQMIAR